MSAGGMEGVRVVVTRPREQAASLVRGLEARGATPIRFPVIEIEPIVDDPRVDAVLAGPEGFDWIIFTSVNGVAAFWERLARLGVRSGAPPGTRVAAIGPATRDALAARGVATSFMPEEHVAERIVDGVGEIAGRRFLLPRAEGARPALREALRGAGGIVQEVPMYRAVGVTGHSEREIETVVRADAVTFTSSSTVRHFVTLVPEAVDVLRKAVVACIGPVTADTARGLGVKVDVVASVYTVPGLVDALAAFYSTGQVGAAPEGSS